MFIDRFIRLIPRNNLKKALAHFNAGDYAKACREFENYLGRLEDDGCGRDQELIRMYMVESYIQSSRMIEENGDAAAAAAQLEKAVALQPGYADVHYGLGRLYEKMGNRVNSRESLKRSLSVNPGYFRARVMLARSYWLDGDSDRAAEEMLQGLAASPAFFVESGKDLAVLLRSDPVCENVENLFKKLLEERPSSSQVSKQLAVEAIQNGDYDRAMAELRKALSLNPNYPDLHNLLGIAYSNTGMIDDALIEFETALKINPDYLKARLNFALTLYEKGTKEEARRQLDRVLRVDPQNELARNLLSELSQMTSAR